MDFSEPRVVIEFGPGEGCHSRKILEHLQPGSKLVLFELDEVFYQHLKTQFANDPRVIILNEDAAHLSDILQQHGIRHCDYVVSGIPFSMIPVDKKRALVQATFDALSDAPHSAFIIYQLTNELRSHAKCFSRYKTEYFLGNIPPMFITSYLKTPEPETAQVPTGSLELSNTSSPD